MHEELMFNLADGQISELVVLDDLKQPFKGNYLFD